MNWLARGSTIVATTVVAMLCFGMALISVQNATPVTISGGIGRTVPLPWGVCLSLAAGTGIIVAGIWRSLGRE